MSASRSKSKSKDKTKDPFINMKKKRVKSMISLHNLSGPLSKKNSKTIPQIIKLLSRKSSNPKTKSKSRQRKIQQVGSKQVQFSPTMRVLDSPMKTNQTLLSMEGDVNVTNRYSLKSGGKDCEEIKAYQLIIKNLEADMASAKQNHIMVVEKSTKTITHMQTK